MIKDVHEKLNTSLSWQGQHSTGTRLFSPANLKKKLLKGYVWSAALYGAGHFGKRIRNTWKVLKYSAGEGWRRSTGPTV
jgi:hypothetical protein